MGKNTPDRQLFILQNLVVESADIESREELPREEEIVATD